MMQGMRWTGMKGCFAGGHMMDNFMQHQEYMWQR
jgi:hypothetical protein